MTGWLLLGVLGSGACAARQPSPEPESTPRWATPSGRDEARFDMVEMLLESGNPEGALALIARVRGEGVDDPRLDLLQGRALRQAGLLDDAAAMLDRVPRRHPVYAAAQNELGVLEMDRKALPAALVHLEAATRAAPEAAPYWNNLGFALLASGRPGEATDALRRSLELDPSNARTRNNLGFALLASKRDDEAWRVLRAAGGGEAEARYNMGVGYELRGDLPAAAQAYQQALNLTPSHAAAAAALERVLPLLPAAPTTPPSAQELP